jgi:hypothetical protein
MERLRIVAASELDDFLLGNGQAPREENGADGKILISARHAAHQPIAGAEARGKLRLTRI